MSLYNNPERDFDPHADVINGKSDESSFPLHGDDVKVLYREERYTPRSLRNVMAGLSIAFILDTTSEGRHQKTPSEAAKYVNKTYKSSPRH